MTDRGWLIICGVLVFVALFNLGLFLSVLRPRRRRRPFLNGSFSDLLDPWKKEDDALEQLHQGVKKLADNEGTGDDRNG